MGLLQEVAGGGQEVQQVQTVATVLQEQDEQQIYSMK